MFIRIIAIAGLLCLGAARHVDAGLYSTADAEEETRLSQDFLKFFHPVLGKLRTISDEKPATDPPIRKRYMLMEALGRQGVGELKTLEQQLNFSVVLIRRGKPEEAIQLLLPLTEEESPHRSNFVVHSHFATAHYLAGSAELRSRAAGIMKECLELWPDRWDTLEPGHKAFLEKMRWEQGVFDQNRKYEVYFERLLRHRARADALLKKKGVRESLDPLFADKDGKPIRFTDDKGKYEAGRIPRLEKDKLPGDAIEIVEQLLVWMPNDLRLYWLLAEVLNASAMDEKDDQRRRQHLLGAHQILKELALGWRNPPEEMTEHYEVVKAYVKDMPENPLPQGLKDLLDKPDKDKDENDLLTNRRWWQTLIVGFGTGLAVGVFALWQMQELRRRRQARDVSSV